MSSTGSISVEEKARIDAWIARNGLNSYGDQQGHMYAGGSPLWNPATGQLMDKYSYVISKHPDRPWNRV